ncbi:hypothetical protein B0H15DRAFT_861166 [Mycena belliarum]|uniref:Uncharacterized protein n=1 Tax=Mycena belliarum TaxID=1033014 RepID=A0AAD6XIX5_9AGAR|nr:hypothetical protein B0H15DRAFT_861166 [Mycena belliae]
MPVSASRRSSRSTPPRSTPRRESIALSSVAMPIGDSDTEPDFDALDSADDPRAPSPDIASILATTPRPRLTSLSRRQSPLPYDEPWEEDFIDDYGSVYSLASKPSGPYAFAFPDVDRPAARSVHPDTTQPTWDEPNDSDSDLDLHTSLPQLMLHHGFLSPRSKLLPNNGSSVSLALPSPTSPSFLSKDPLPRDTRDTPRRRVRHRDGKTLRGGIGLTTGLGWSDSEDEDAPSALTRRISSLDLNRSSSHLSFSRASSLSIRSSAYSSAPRPRRAQSESESPPDVDEFGTWSARKGSGTSSAPPTSWARRSEPSARLSRVQSQSSLGPRITRTPSTRTDDSTTSGATTTSVMSLPLMRSRSRVLRVMMADKEKPLPRTPSLRRNPSTASNMGTATSGLRPRAATGVNASSLPKAHSGGRATPLSMQSTPQAGPPPASTTAVPAMPAPALTTSGSKSQMRPLRLRPPVLGGDRAPVPVPAVINVGLPASSTASSLASSASGSSALSASTSATSVSLLSPSASYAQPARSPSPYARAPSSPGFAAQQSFPRSPPSPGFMAQGFAEGALGTPITPTTPMYDQGGIARPRPRVGAGMTYRTSTYGAPRSLPVRTSAKAVAL